MGTVYEQSPSQGTTHGALKSIRNYLELTKPSITRMCVITTAGGFWLAPSQIDALTAVCAMLGTALAVSSANVFNMWWERDVDGLMSRTESRPLPTGRVTEHRALSFGVVLGLAAMVVLALGTNLLTAGLSLFAILSYVLIYTPMKYVAPISTAIGAIPGAIPPLLGWTAATGRIDGVGLALFGVLFCWQIPHFIAISVMRQKDYDNAGIKIVPSVRGMLAAKTQTILWCLALIAVSMYLASSSSTGLIFTVCTLASGLFFTGWSIAGLWTRDDRRWGRQLFFVSLAYLPIVIVALALDKTF
jgi:protoheme IX farnesyltransferase